LISIVIVGRNDNYGGDFEDRLLETTRYNIGELQRRGVEVELIFVEWNPLTDRPLLSEKVAAAFDPAQCIVVDEEVHRLVSQNRSIKVFEYHAKNVGAWRASGDWLLLTNPDDFFGKQIFDFLEGGVFDPDTLYRAGWIDIEDSCDVDRADAGDFYAEDPPPYYSASGDFIFCSRALFDRVGGFREDLAFTNTHKDSILCRALFDLTGRAQKIGNTYHLHHSRDLAGNRRVQYVWTKVDRSHQAHYGLSEGCVVSTIRPRITRLSLPAWVSRATNDNASAKPKVPLAYRKPVNFKSGVSVLRRFAARLIDPRRG
jgi:hypothetical protein